MRLLSKPLLLAIVAFICLGLPDGILGVAWPSIRKTFDLPLSALGGLLFAAMTGYLASSFTSGWLVQKMGLGRLLVASNGLVLASLLGFATAPAWPVMVACGVLAGLGAGGIDAGINAYAAASFSPRVVNWLHASYGVGATLGPLLMTGVLQAGLAWRWGYGLVSIVLATLAAGFLKSLDLWKVAPNSSGEPPAQPARIRETLARPVVWFNIALFFLYTGIEAAAGQWTYSLVTEARGVSPMRAGLWASAYWLSLAAGRIILGSLAGRVRPGALLRAGMISGSVGVLALWSNAGETVTFLGIALAGFSFAPIFPLLISLTPERVGAAHSDNAVGFQISAAYLGAAALPGAVGTLSMTRSLEILGPFLFVSTVALFLLNEAATRQSTTPAPQLSLNNAPSA